MRESNNDVEGKSIIVTCDDTEVNKTQEGHSWLMGFAIQLLRCFPFTKVRVK